MAEQNKKSSESRMTEFEKLLRKAVTTPADKIIQIKKLNEKYEIKDAAGKTIKFTRMGIPECDVSNFRIVIELESSGTKFNREIPLLYDIYKKDTASADINKTIEVKQATKLYISLQTLNMQEKFETAFLKYCIF